MSRYTRRGRRLLRGTPLSVVEIAILYRTSRLSDQDAREELLRTLIEGGDAGLHASAASDKDRATGRKLAREWHKVLCRWPVRIWPQIFAEIAHKLGMENPIGDGLRHRVELPCTACGRTYTCWSPVVTPEDPDPAPPSVFVCPRCDSAAHDRGVQ